MQFSNDRLKLGLVETAKFIKQCQEEFEEKPLAISNQKKVKLLTLASFLPNLFSALTAGFFVVYVLSGFSWKVGIFLGFLLLALVLAIEAGKRLFITGMAKEWFTQGKAQAIYILALLVCFGLSMSASYVGGNKLVTETASPPARETNPQIDSLNRILAEQQATIARLQNTTWKGKVTRKAQAGINEAKALQNKIYSRIAQLEAQDDLTHSEALQKHTAKHLNFGLVLGILAALSDFFLLGLLWTAKKLKYQVFAIHSPTAQASPLPQGQGYKIPSISGLDPSLNQQPGKRQIGFFSRKEETGSAEPEEDPNPSVTNPTVSPELKPGEKICLHCRKVYRYKVNWQKFCCKDCKEAYHAQKHGGKAFNPKRYHRTKNA
jgi:hypothetical protein